MMQRSAFTVAIDMREGEDMGLAGGEQLLGGKFRRRVQVKRGRLAVDCQGFGCKSMEMRLVAGRYLQRRRIDLDEITRGEESSQRRLHPVAANQEGPAVGMAVLGPPGECGDAGMVHGRSFLALSGNVSQCRGWLFGGFCVSCAGKET
ncbi:hypothetical protein D3C71_658640 [compost metagenome]